MEECPRHRVAQLVAWVRGRLDGRRGLVHVADQQQPDDDDIGGRRERRREHARSVSIEAQRARDAEAGSHRYAPERRGRAPDRGDLDRAQESEAPPGR